MKILKAVSAIAVVFSFVSLSGCGNDATMQREPVTLEQRLAEIASKTEDIESYRVIMTMEMEAMGQTMTTEQEIAFKKPDKMRMTMKMNMMGGMTQEIYSSGDTTWTYMPMMGMVMKMDMKKFKGAGRDHPGMAGSGDIVNLFKHIPEDRIEYIEDKVTSEGLVSVFELKMDFGKRMPRKAAEKSMLAKLPKEQVVWINADTGLPVKTITVGKDGNTMMEQTYSDFEINPEIDDAIFEFTPPEGIQVMDMTKGMTNMMEGVLGKEGMQKKKRMQRKKNMSGDRPK